MSKPVTVTVPWEIAVAMEHGLDMVLHASSAAYGPGRLSAGHATLGEREAWLANRERIRVGQESLTDAMFL